MSEADRVLKEIERMTGKKFLPIVGSSARFSSTVDGLRCRSPCKKG